jgi:putative Holliday junction resolvase
MKIMAIDVGLKRIGVAYTPNGSVVVPLKAIIRKNRNQASREVSELLKEWKIDKLIVGIPFTNEDTSNRIKHFTNLIDFNGIVEFVDESFSSFEVEQSMKGEIKYKRDGRIDSLAAKNILERYLDSQKIC